VTDDEQDRMLQYLRDDVIRRPAIELTAQTPLVSSGLVDSFALIDVLLKLEDVLDLRIPASRVQPKDLDTVERMIGTARRLGKPRS